MEQYLSGAAIMERYRLAPFQFAHLINKGAVPLSPLTSEPLLCLTDPESWLHDLNAVVLEATGLLMLLWETFPNVPSATQISKDSFVILASYPLAKMAGHKATQGLFGDEIPIEREPKGFFTPLAGFFTKKSHPELYRSVFFHSSALLYSANGQKSVWPLLQKINDSNDKWLKIHRRFFKDGLQGSYANYLSQFFLEQTNGQIEHPLVCAMLGDFSPVIPKLQEFTVYYWETDFKITSSRRTNNTNFDPSAWARSTGMLTNWEESTNLYRLNTLAAIIQDLRKDFYQVHLPWEKPIKTTNLEESFTLLEKAIFEQQSIEKICEETFKPQPAEIKRKILKEVPDGQAAEGNKTRQDTVPTAEDEPPSPTTTLTSDTPAHWATIYRAHKKLAATPDEKEVWEMMALRLEGLTGYDIFKQVFPHKAKQTAIGTAKAHISRTIRNRGLRLLEAAGLPVIPELLPGKKGKI